MPFIITKYQSINQTLLKLLMLVVSSSKGIQSRKYIVLDMVVKQLSLMMTVQKFICMVEQAIKYTIKLKNIILALVRLHL